ncbi:hypothetical protein [Mycobacterium sp.]|uniref:hypothetical protein n=1 Tax=Mycobacterium sp. TaxID=1785 RepID=UPI003F97244C
MSETINWANPTMTDLMRAFARAEKLVAGDLGISVEQLRARNRPAPDTEQQPPSQTTSSHAAPAANTPTTAITATAAKSAATCSPNRPGAPATARLS